MPIPTYNANDNSAGQPVAEPVAQTAQATGAGVNTGAGITRPKTAAELEADRLYEEQMEEEYAKREGGS
ncbi:uncharacterized protein E0L32_001392 [Thyridium curvatum]|uniref:Uncharacterized protein n=1 Tax=Thyridium curvatum TaxID=1093900 RepID=A0A507AIX8_9PEZI|nr:uncharacterized protein E0L32_001392 [Thyridium curvatum]TPX10195.1 hypothetical protein E0L32_001392 [Thyridium curvatum]